MAFNSIHISIIIATHDRLALLKECINSITLCKYPNFEVIIAHSGYSDGTLEYSKTLPKNFHYLCCKEKGAASQRNEAIKKINGQWTLFLDDDVILDHKFLHEINNAILNNDKYEAISGAITNQFFTKLSFMSNCILILCGINPFSNLSGKVVGPALNFFPKKEGAIYEEIQWMPTCVAAYKTSSLIKSCGFPSYFKGYSFGEDLFLSLSFSQNKPILLSRKAKLFHHDTGSRSQEDIEKSFEMQIKNRRFICKYQLNRNSLKTKYQLLVWHFLINVKIFLINDHNPRGFIQSLRGILKGLHAKI